MNRYRMIIFYRIIFIFLCFWGILLSLMDHSSDHFMGNGTAIHFYTIQSNIWVLLLEIFLLFFTAFDYKKHSVSNNDEKPLKMNSRMNKHHLWNVTLFKFIFTTAIMLTFLIYWLLLAPFFNLDYIFQPQNLLVHGVTPIFMLVDFLYFDNEYIFPKKGILLSLIPGMYYLIFILIRAEVSNVRLTYGSRYPYWFMDVDAFRMVWKPKRDRSSLLG